MKTAREWTDELKWCIRHDDYEQLNELWLDLEECVRNKEVEYRVCVEYIYTQAYLCAVSNGKSEIKEWFEKMFEKLDEVTQIALRPTFIYAKYVTPRKSGSKRA